MKYKHLAVLMGLVVTVSSMNVYTASAGEETAAEETAESTEEETAESTEEEATEEETADETADEAADEAADEEEILGEVTAVDGDKLTIAVGTRKDMGQGGAPGEGADGEAQAPENTGAEADAEAGEDAEADAQAEEETEAESEEDVGEEADAEAGADAGEEADAEAEEDAEAGAEADAQADTAAAADGGENAGAPELPEGGEGGQGSSFLELTGEEMTFTVTEDTVITRSSMGQPDGGMGGQPGDGGQPGGGEQPGDGGQPGGGEQPGGEGQPEDAGQPEGESQPEDAEQPEGEGQPEDAEQPEGEGQPEDAEQPEGEGQPEDAEQPEGEGQPGGTPGGSEEITLDDIAEGDVVAITADEDGNALTITVQSGDMGGGQGMGGAPGGQSSGVDSYDAANEYTSDEEVTETSLESTGTDENAALISEGASVSFDNVTLTRDSADSTGGDNSSFYGVGAALLATDGQAYVSGGSVTTDASGAAGLFAYGDGTVYAADMVIRTQQDTSGGIHAAGGGTFYGWDLDVETNGESAAAIRSDRGGGTMVVDGGTYTSNGEGSPAVYCTADIAVNNATLTATGSEGICIEGLNSLHLFDCDLTGNMSDLGQNDTTWTVILYQSMSGDSEIGNSTFQMKGGSLTSENGGLFYTTNTECTIALEDVDIEYNEDNEFFLQCTGNNNERGWGESGANGSDCHFTAVGQDMLGDVIWDSISDLDFYMTQGSSLKGAVVNDETYAGNGGEGYCNVYIDGDSVWTVTGDSTLSSLSCEGTVVDDQGSTVSIVGTDGTVYVEGDSQYTVTVDSYQDSADLSDSTTLSSWSEYEVEKPEQL